MISIVHAEEVQNLLRPTVYRPSVAAPIGNPVGLRDSRESFVGREAAAPRGESLSMRETAIR
jgi:hypothetical protein